MSFLKHEICVIRNSGNDIQMSCQSLVYVYRNRVHNLYFYTLLQTKQKNKS